MRPIATGAKMREIDRLTIEEDGLAGIVLMENAGRGIANEILRRFPQLELGRVVVIIGKGNNGGDGLVVARQLLAAGVEPLVFSVGEPDKLKGNALTNWQVWQASGRGAFVIKSKNDLRELRVALAQAEVIVDALLGIGVQGAPRGLFAPVIEAVNKSTAFTVAVDIPSGVDADSGQAELAVWADLTVTMATPKTGLFLSPGYDCVGELITVPIGVLPGRFDELNCFYAEPADAASFFEPPSVDLHKYQRGSVAVLAGCRDYSGAAGLTCLGASKTGAGLVNLLTTTATLTYLKPRLLGITSFELPDEAGFISPFGVEVALAQLNKSSAAVIGPGLGNDETVGAALREILPGVEIPVVIDADGLNTTSLELIAAIPSPKVITPHTGEAARLLDCTSKDIQQDRLGKVRELAKRSGGVALLKGYRSIVAAPDGRVCFIPTGDWRMAVAGSGDVLAGMLGALLARGGEPFEATVAAAWLHGLAGELAAEAMGDWSVSPEDIIEAIPQAIDHALAD